MRLGDWLASRTPRPPTALAERIGVLLAGDREAATRDIPDRCMSAAERVLRELVTAGAPSRDSALDLLAADALVTYAFEAASDDPARLEHRARDAMQRIAALAGDGGTR